MYRGMITGCVVAALGCAAMAGNWPHWRGPGGNGIAAETAKPPSKWSENQNVKWKVEVPGFGLSTPVIWEDRIFLLAASRTDKPADTTEIDRKKASLPGWRRPGARSAKHEHSFRVLCLDRHSGKTLWDTTVRQELPNEPIHPAGSWASASPVTDGKHVWASFGSHGLYCLDMDGEVKWEKQLGRMTTRNHFGEGSSPALGGDVLVVNWDHQGDSFIVALDKATGRELWRKARDEVSSWSTPKIIEVDGRRQVVVTATGKTRAYDLKTGKVIWHLGGMTQNVIPMPMYVDGRLYLTSGFRGSALQCVDPAGASGDIAGTEAVVWTLEGNTPYVPSAVCYDGVVYYLRENRALLSACGAATGQVLYGPTELEPIEFVYASLLAADGRIYVTGREGTTVVLQAGKRHKVLAVNHLDDKFDASVAAVDGQLFLRGHRHLYCLEDASARSKAEASWQRLLVAGYGYGQMQILRRDGTVEWSMDSRDKTCDAWMLDDGQIVYSCARAGTKIVKPDYEKGQGGEVVWHRPVPEGCETHSCQPLAGGRFLIGESYDGVSYVLEVDRAGKEYERIKLEGIGSRHGTFRVIRKTPQGTYLVAGSGEGYKGRRAMEIDAEGKVIRRYPGGGYMALRLPNGNTLLSSGDTHLGDCEARVFEVDPAGKIVWKLEHDELLPKIRIGYSAGVQRLPNGNTLICNGGYHLGPDAEPGAAIFEITPAKKVVWTSPEEMANKVTSVMVLDDRYRRPGPWR